MRHGHIRAMPMMENAMGSPLRMRMEERVNNIYGGMPFFLGYYWQRDNAMDNKNNMGDGLDLFPF